MASLIDSGLSFCKEGCAALGVAIAAAVGACQALPQQTARPTLDVLFALNACLNLLHEVVPKTPSASREALEKCMRKSCVDALGAYARWTDEDALSVMARKYMLLNHPREYWYIGSMFAMSATQKNNSEE